MNEEIIKEYVNVTVEQDDRQKVLDYLASDKAEWIKNILVIPEKINMIVSLVQDGFEVDSEE